MILRCFILLCVLLTVTAARRRMKNRTVTRSDNSYYILTNRSVKPKFNESDPCGTSLLMSDTQREMCYNSSVLSETFSAAGVMAKNWTEKLFKENYNKLGVDLYYQSPLTFWVERSTKEAGFVVAIRAALYALFYWEECIRSPQKCNCGSNGKKYREVGRRYQFRWKNCPEGLDEAVDFTVRWIGSDSYLLNAINPYVAPVAHHNMHAGLGLLKSMVRQETNCADLDHDDSLCRTGFVRKIPPQISALAHAVFEKYTQSRPVFHPRWGTIRKEFRKSIIFAEKSIP